MKKNLLFITLVLLCSYACSKYAESLSPPTTKDIIEKQAFSTRLLTVDEAAYVAQAFIGGGGFTTKNTNSELSVNSVIPIKKDDSQSAAMYAVNLTNGYILISAATSYAPIIAYVDSGHFDTESLSTPQRDLINSYLADMSIAKPDSLNDVFLLEWKKYFKYFSHHDSGIINTRSELDFYLMLDDYIEDWEDEGLDVYMLSDKPDDLPNTVYQDFCYIAQQYRPSDANYLNHACITEDYYINHIVNRGPFLATHWGQHYPYNAAVQNGSLLGCTTVALAQFMRFYEKPTSYDWQSMLNQLSSPDTVTTAFLASVKNQLCGSLFLITMHTVLGLHGYQSHYGSLSGAQIKSILQSGKPILMGGNPTGPDLDNGHAWVCDGIQYSTWVRHYDLYSWSNLNDLSMVWLTDYEKQSSSVVYYHMNWGWDGLDDGWYYINNSGLFLNNSSSYDYSALRIDIYVDDAIPY